MESYPETNCYHSRVHGALVNSERELCVGYRPEGATVGIYTREEGSRFRHERTFQYKSYDFYGYRVMRRSMSLQVYIKQCCVTGQLSRRQWWSAVDDRES